MTLAVAQRFDLVIPISLLSRHISRATTYNEDEQCHIDLPPRASCYGLLRVSQIANHFLGIKRRNCVCHCDSPTTKSSCRSALICCESGQLNDDSCASPVGKSPPCLPYDTQRATTAESLRRITVHSTRPTCGLHSLRIVVLLSANTGTSGCASSLTVTPSFQPAVVGKTCRSISAFEICTRS